ncbi:2-methylaconitate cis-trans isomerase PrpF family protein [uncultured Ruegeria sp.]|uniref:2-methylaconitate cis-trans isomerase PrpF family protein n=1 Tax=uncultured Ruegeria sp. TaxID=259304 RepID=UPI00260F1ED5|nr:PrpF domain-containing protein [uncultured Ruegeria sp.]
MVEGLRAAFYRGGTSKAVVFRDDDLPEDRALRDRIFLHVLGSPDPYGRQLDGMGGGLSSLSKVVIVKPSDREDADVDYTFVQVAVKDAVADYGSACGNMSSCVGPFAVDEGMVPVKDNETRAVVRIYSTNTDSIYVARFPVKDGKAVEQGDFEIPGVSGTGAKITIDFLDPGGASTGKLLPSGNPLDMLDIDGHGPLEVSLIDAANAVVFCRAADVGKTAVESPQELDGDTEFMALVEKIRCAGAVAMGMAADANAVARSSPKIAIVSGPSEFVALNEITYAAETHDLNVRLVSMGNFHRAITLTGGMCTAVAAQIPGTLVRSITQPSGRDLHIGNPSGLLPATAQVLLDASGPDAIFAGTFRTQRRIMEGRVLFPSSLLEVPP